MSDRRVEGTNVGLARFVGESVQGAKDFVLEEPRRFLPGIRAYCDLVFLGGSELGLKMVDKVWPAPETYPEALLKAESYVVLGVGLAFLGAKTIRDYFSEVIDFTTEK